MPSARRAAALGTEASAEVAALAPVGPVVAVAVRGTCPAEPVIDRATTAMLMNPAAVVLKAMTLLAG